MSRRLANVAVFLFCAVVVACGRPAMAASDNAGNPPYADGWQTGDNGGTGYGAWTLPPPSGAGVNSINTPASPDNQLGAPAFSMASDNRPYFSDTNSALRPITSGLGVGSTFSIDVDGPVLTSPAGFGYDSGSAVQLFNASGQELLALYSTGYPSAYFWQVADGGTNNNSQTLTDIEAAKGFNLKMSITGASTYAMKVTSYDPSVHGGLPWVFIGNLKSPAGGQAADSFGLFTYGTGLNAPLYFNNPTTRGGIVPEPSSVVLVLIGIVAAAAIGARRKK